MDFKKNSINQEITNILKYLFQKIIKNYKHFNTFIKILKIQLFLTLYKK